MGAAGTVGAAGIKMAGTMAIAVRRPSRVRESRAMALGAATRMEKGGEEEEEKEKKEEGEEVVVWGSNQW